MPGIPPPNRVMTTAAQIPPQQFEVSRLSAPPAVLLRQLRGAASYAAEPIAALLYNPALLMRVLQRLAASAPADITSAGRLRRLERTWLQDQILQSAFEHGVHHDKSERIFLVRHWQMSRRIAALAAALARATAYRDPDTAALTGLLLRAGMLVLEQQYPAYAALTDSAWQQAALLQWETEAFERTHIEAGVRLLSAWHLDPFCIDALRYQALPPAQVLDAAPLVKICWLANALVGGGCADPGVLEQGRHILQVSTETLQRLLTEVDATFIADNLALDLPVLPEVELPDSLICHVLASSQQQVLQLREEVTSRVQLNRHAALPVVTPDTLRDLLITVLEEAGIEARFIVMTASAANAQLQVYTSAGIPADLAGFNILCHAGRSALADAVLSGDATLIGAHSKGLTVSDQQLLGLLDPAGFICESVLHAQGRTVLLLAAGSAWLQRAALRDFVRSKLPAAGNTQAASSVDLLLYRQQVREAVHEAGNPLTIIKNYLHILEQRQDEQQLAVELRIMRSEIDRAASILASMLTPVDASPSMEVVDLNKLASTVHVVFAGAHSQPAHGVQLQLAPRPALVRGNAGMLKQVLINLVKNAMEALAGEGCVTLSTQTNIWQGDQFHVRLTVADTGPGIAAELMPQLFTHGTSTREGKHRGSGLAIVQRLVDTMQGRISCASDTNGTALTLWFPQAQHGP